jgi:ABC-type sugar transport system substrate-binding protein
VNVHGSGTSHLLASGRVRGVLFAALLVAALALAGSASSRTQIGKTGSSAASPGASVSLGLVLDDCVNPVELPLRRGAQAASKKLHFSLKIVCPSPVTAQQQISLMQTLTVQHPNGIVILPVDSVALVPAINAAISAGITVATTELDAPTSKRSFFYFGGTPPLGQGKMQADRVAAYFKRKHAKGNVNYYVTSCLPTVTGQQDRRRGFEQEAARLNGSGKYKFKLKEVGFANTTTDPAKNLVNITNIYTAAHSKIQVAYAMCGPDTQNWGTVLHRNGNHKILVAGYDWLPQTLNLIGQGWVAWSLGSSLYREGLYTFTVLYNHFAKHKPLLHGVHHGTSIFATKANLKKIRNSPDVKSGG